MRNRNQMTKSRFLALPAVLLAVASAACSEGVARLSPVGPSAVVEATAAPSAATTTTWASRNGWSTLADGRVAVADGLLVEGADVVETVTGSCPGRTIFLRGVPVSVTTATTFAAPLTCETLAGGRAVKVTGLLTHEASGFSVSATNVALVNADESPAPAPVSPGPGSRRERLNGEGVVGSVKGGCPDLTLVILGYRVQTKETTAYTGGACADLREGAKVKLTVEDVEGTFVAEKIEILSVPGKRG